MSRTEIEKPSVFRAVLLQVTLNLFAREANESNVGSKKKSRLAIAVYVLVGGVWFGLLLREAAFARRGNGDCFGRCANQRTYFIET
jgi:hypothetical protein